MKTVQKRVFSACWTLTTTAYAFICVSRANFKIYGGNGAKTRFFGMLNSCECCVCLYFAFLKHFSKIDDENKAKTRFLACWTLATTAYAFILRFLSTFRKLMMKTVQKRVFWHVEHLRLLHMPLFAFLQQFSIIDDETLQKRVFSACWTLTTSAYAFNCVSWANFKNWWWKQCKNAFFQHVELLRMLRMPLFCVS